MKRSLRIICAFLALFTLCLTPALAAEETPSVSATETEVLVDQTNGRFQFTIEVTSQAAYAGAEFGVYCSQGLEITSVTATGGSITGPQAANGLVWFGFFDGSDSFTGTTTVTVAGTCQERVDGAVAIQDVKLYTVGNQEYASTAVECGQVVNLYWELPVAMEPVEEGTESSYEPDIDVPLIIICCTVIAAAVAGALIYIKTKNNKNTKNQKEKEYASEKTEE